MPKTSQRKVTQYDKIIIQRNNQLIGFIIIFLIYFETFPVPTADTLFMLILSILTLESAHSICFLYKHFLSGITKQTLNAFNYVCSYENVDYYIFMNTIVWIALKLITDLL